MLLQITLQRTCTECRIIGILHNLIHGCRRQLYRQLLLTKSAIQLIHQDIDNAVDVILRQRLKENDLIKTV